MQRIAALERPIPLAQFPEAIARSREPRRPPVPGRWPPAAAGIGAWAETLPAVWARDGDVLTPRGAAMPREGDRLMIAVFADRTSPVLTWSQLRDLLAGTGMGALSAQAWIHRSPLIRSVPGGYRLLG